MPQLTKDEALLRVTTLFYNAIARVTFVAEVYTFPSASDVYVSV
ncbi:MAG: hypothetical protein ACOCXT_04705 [Candidatus Dojkabacteria bacterium]